MRDRKAPVTVNSSDFINETHQEAYRMPCRVLDLVACDGEYEGDECLCLFAIFWLGISLSNVFYCRFQERWPVHYVRKSFERKELVSERSSAPEQP